MLTSSSNGLGIGYLVVRTSTNGGFVRLRTTEFDELKPLVRGGANDAEGGATTLPMTLLQLLRLVAV